jgi:hypothetical protein
MKPEKVATFDLLCIATTPYYLATTTHSTSRVALWAAATWVATTTGWPGPSGTGDRCGADIHVTHAAAARLVALWQLRLRYYRTSSGKTVVYALIEPFHGAAYCQTLQASEHRDKFTVSGRTAQLRLLTAHDFGKGEPLTSAGCWQAQTHRTILLSRTSGLKLDCDVALLDPGPQTNSVSPSCAPCNPRAPYVSPVPGHERVLHPRRRRRRRPHAHSD